MKDAPVIRATAGRPPKGNGDNITIKRGTSAEYLAGLLKRDHPDIAAAIITLPRKENATAGNLAQRKNRPKPKPGRFV